MEEKMFEKEIEVQRESRQFQLQMMHHWYTVDVVVRHHSHHLWQHPLNILTSKDQCIHLMMMILHKSNKCKLNYMRIYVRIYA